MAGELNMVERMVAAQQQAAALIHPEIKAGRMTLEQGRIAAARAVLTAMRDDPPEAMWGFKAREVILNDRCGWPNRRPKGDVVVDVWRAMIDAALADPSDAR